jgi:hypothetical protein
MVMKPALARPVVKHAQGKKDQQSQQNICTSSMSQDPTKHTHQNHTSTLSLSSASSEAPSRIALASSKAPEIDYFSFTILVISTSTASSEVAPGTVSMSASLVTSFFFQHGLKESNNKVRITESKQKLKISKYLFLFGTNNRQHVIVTKRTPLFL